MSSLIIELQKELINPKTKLSNLLRNALLVASKLKINGVDKWLRLEMNGYYEENSVLPDYRMVTGHPKAYSYRHGWLDIAFKNFPADVPYKQFSLPNSIAEMETTLEDIDNDVLVLIYPEEINDFICKFIKADKTGFEFTRSQMKGIIDKVRNMILDWTIELESKGIIGENLSFSIDEIKKAKNVVVNIFQGNILDSQINSSSKNSKLNL
jgi:hypothetical protein